MKTQLFAKVLSLAAPYFSVLFALPPISHSHTLNIPSCKTLLQPVPLPGICFPPYSIWQTPTSPSRSSSKVPCCGKPYLSPLDKSKPLLHTYYALVPELGTGM